MSYLVLARKYRPKTFADVAGQPHVVRPLLNALKSGRIAHAYLFSGARGVGKTTVARLLAMALNCRTEDRDRPCGECESCLEIIEGHAVDVYEIDGASNRGINEIRDLRETIKYLPGKSVYKVYIIDEVHMLTKEAFNALLKTLEEPPEHVIFIFATTEAHKVLPTILSRCQRYDFKRIGSSEIIARLETIALAENIEIGPVALRLLTRESEGSLRDALSLFDQTIAFSGTSVRDEDVAEALGLIDQTLISELVKALLAGEAGEALENLDRAYNYGHDTKDFSAQVLDYVRALVVVKVAKTPENVLDLLDTELAEVKKVAEGASLETLNFHFNAWLEVQGRLHRSSHPRLVLEALIVRLAQIEPLRPLAEMAARIEALLASSGPAGPRPRSGGGPVSPPPSKPPPGRAGPPDRGSRLFSGPAAAEAPGDYTAPTPAESEPAKPAAREVDQGDDAPRTWEAFAVLLQGESPLQFSIINQGEVRAFGPDRVEIVLGYRNGSDLVDKEKIRELLNVFFQAKPELHMHYDETAAANSPNGQNHGAGAAEKIKEEILDHPLIKEAQQMFSGEVLDVIPEG